MGETFVREVALADVEAEAVVADNDAAAGAAAKLKLPQPVATPGALGTTLDADELEGVAAVL